MQKKRTAFVVHCGSVFIGFVVFWNIPLYFFFEPLVVQECAI